MIDRKRQINIAQDTAEEPILYLDMTSKLRCMTADNMNKNQKKLLLVALILFALTILFVPEGGHIGLGVGEMRPFFVGYTTIWSVETEISMKHLFVEWFGILVGFVGLLFYYKD